MRLKDIEVGQDYVWDDNRFPRRKRVTVLEVGVDRPRASGGYWKPRQKETLPGGVKIRLGADAKGTVGKDELVVRPQEIIRPWADEQAMRDREAEYVALKEKVEAESREINRPLRDAVVAALAKQDGIYGYTIESIANDDQVLAGSKTFQLSLSVGDLARLMGIEGDFVSASKRLYEALAKPSAATENDR